MSCAAGRVQRDGDVYQRDERAIVVSSRADGDGELAHRDAVPSSQQVVAGALPAGGGGVNEHAAIEDVLDLLDLACISWGNLQPICRACNAGSSADFPHHSLQDSPGGLVHLAAVDIVFVVRQGTAEGQAGRTHQQSKQHDADEQFRESKSFVFRTSIHLAHRLPSAWLGLGTTSPYAT